MRQEADNITLKTWTPCWRGGGAVPSPPNKPIRRPCVQTPPQHADHWSCSLHFPEWAEGLCQRVLAGWSSASSRRLPVRPPGRTGSQELSLQIPGRAGWMRWAQKVIDVICLLCIGKSLQNFECYLPRSLAESSGIFNIFSLGEKGATKSMPLSRHLFMWKPFQYIATW